jgi:hypothetical protein
MAIAPGPVARTNRHGRTSIRRSRVQYLARHWNDGSSTWSRFNYWGTTGGSSRKLKRP